MASRPSDTWLSRYLLVTINHRSRSRRTKPYNLRPVVVEMLVNFNSCVKKKININCFSYLNVSPMAIMFSFQLVITPMCANGVDIFCLVNDLYLVMNVTAQLLWVLLLYRMFSPCTHARMYALTNECIFVQMCYMHACTRSPLNAHTSECVLLVLYDVI